MGEINNIGKRIMEWLKGDRVVAKSVEDDDLLQLHLDIYMNKLNSYGVKPADPEYIDLYLRAGELVEAVEELAAASCRDFDVVLDIILLDILQGDEKIDSLLELRENLFFDKMTAAGLDHGRAEELMRVARDAAEMNDTYCGDKTLSQVLDDLVESGQRQMDVMNQMLGRKYCVIYPLLNSGLEERRLGYQVRETEESIIELIKDRKRVMGDQFNISDLVVFYGNKIKIIEDYKLELT